MLESHIAFPQDFHQIPSRMAESRDLFNKAALHFERAYPEKEAPMVKKDPALFKVRPQAGNWSRSSGVQGKTAP
jgi:hypothetical protein